MGLFSDLSEWMDRITREASRGLDKTGFLNACQKAFPQGELGTFALDHERQCACFRGSVGKFTFTAYQMAMASDELYALPSENIQTALAIEFPQVESLAFTIHKDDDSDSEDDVAEVHSPLFQTLRRLKARLPCDDLKALMHDKAVLTAIHRLLSRRRGEIVCEPDRFWVIVEEEIHGVQETARFIASALRVFQGFARPANLATPAWRSPRYGHDWWQPLDLPPDDLPPPEDAQSERVADFLRTLYPLPEHERAAAHSQSPKIDPKKFVLCSACLGELDVTLVNCPSCGAGHHWACASGRCGECGADMNRSPEPPPIPDMEDDAMTGAAAIELKSDNGATRMLPGKTS